jgi:hypothetical protein
VSTPTSESEGRWDPLAGDLEDPACFLTSGEEVFWSQPRAAWRLGVAAGPDPQRALLVLRIDPPAIGQPFGLGGDDVREIVVTPVTPRDSVDPLRLPVDVNLLLLRRPWTPELERLDRADLWLVSRGKLVSTWSQAEAVDRRMQRANGPRA